MSIQWKTGFCPSLTHDFIAETQRPLKIAENLPYMKLSLRTSAHGVYPALFGGTPLRLKIRPK